MPLSFGSTSGCYSLGKTYKKRVATSGGYFFGITSTGAVYKSTTGTSGWSQSGTTGLSSINESGYRNNVLIGFNGSRSFVRSTDYGATFSSPATAHSNGVYTYQLAGDPTGQYWITGTDFGYLAYSTNSGSSWTTIQPSSSNIYPATYVNGYFLCASYNTSTFKIATASSPGSWSNTGSVSKQFSYLFWSCTDSSTNKVYATDANSSTGVIHYSSDNGSNWTMASGLISGSYPGQRLAATNGTLVVSNGSTTVYSTTNNGNSFTTYNLGSTINYISAHNGVFLAACASGLYSSTNGTSWSQQVSGNFTSVCCGA